VLSLSREVLERVVWEVVPTLAETLIREEIQRLVKE
jgi:cell pole-organizing protein PopZ